MDAGQPLVPWRTVAAALQLVWVAGETHQLNLPRLMWLYCEGILHQAAQYRSSAHTLLCCRPSRAADLIGAVHERHTEERLAAASAGGWPSPAGSRSRLATRCSLEQAARPGCAGTRGPTGAVAVRPADVCLALGGTPWHFVRSDALLCRSCLCLCRSMLSAAAWPLQATRALQALFLTCLHLAAGLALGQHGGCSLPAWP